MSVDFDFFFNIKIQEKTFRTLNIWTDFSAFQLFLFIGLEIWYDESRLLKRRFKLKDLDSVWDSIQIIFPLMLALNKNFHKKVKKKFFETSSKLKCLHLRSIKNIYVKRSIVVRWRSTVAERSTQHYAIKRHVTAVWYAVSVWVLCDVRCFELCFFSNYGLWIYTVIVETSSDKHLEREFPCEVFGIVLVYKSTQFEIQKRVWYFSKENFILFFGDFILKLWTTCGKKIKHEFITIKITSLQFTILQSNPHFIYPKKISFCLKL